MDTSSMLAQGTMLRNSTYRIERQLASGGFGNTYLVKNVLFDETFAMKEFFMRGVNLREGNHVTVSVPDNHASYDSQKEKFKKEAVRLRNLSNAHIVKVHDLFEENGTAYYVMDYVCGESLAELLKRTGTPISEEKAWQLLPQLLDALRDVHAQHIWHLDIKPGNIMLDQKGNAYLIDFGASKQFSTSSGQTSSALCYTPGYAPVEQVEQAMDKFGPWTDFYALGATLYYMQTLRQPPSSTALGEGDAFQFPDTMSQRMRDLIIWMMKPARKERPQSVADIEERMASIAPEKMKEGTQEGAGSKKEEALGMPLFGNDGTQGSEGTKDSENGKETVIASSTGDKSKEGSKGLLWKILLPLLIIALGVGAYFLFFSKSPEQKAAEQAKSEYEELVSDFREALDEAESFPELTKAKKMLEDIEDLEDIHARALPDVYNQLATLKKDFRKAEKKQKEVCLRAAEQLKDEDDYRGAYELYKEAAECMTDDEEIQEYLTDIAEDMGFLDVTDVQYANCEKDGTDIDVVGSTLYASKMRYLFPKVIYNSLMPEGHEMMNVELQIKIINPDGTMKTGSDSPYGYTYKSSFNVVVGEQDQGEWLRGYGNATTTTYTSGEYRIELYYKGRKIYTGSVHLY